MEEPRELLLPREGLMEPRELLLPREGLMEPRELLLPREGLMEPRELLLLPRELLPEPWEPLWACAGASRTRRTVVRTRESWRSRRIAIPLGAVRMADGASKLGAFGVRGT